MHPLDRRVALEIKNPTGDFSAKKGQEQGKELSCCCCSQKLNSLQGVPGSLWLLLVVGARPWPVRKLHAEDHSSAYRRPLHNLDASPASLSFAPCPPPRAVASPSVD
ncbi:hypothetical protein NCS52_00708800 [Fusarium sp. LHS14.1]|nr:hypothetical protein NCS52_00708800 [Fusarium sp. LHS14.1]